jgi:hypothetical protein
MNQNNTNNTQNTNNTNNANQTVHHPKKINRKQVLATIRQLKSDLARTHKALEGLEWQLLSLRGPGRPVGWRKNNSNNGPEIPATEEQINRIRRLYEVARNMPQDNKVVRDSVSFLGGYLNQQNKTYAGAESVINNTTERLNNAK